MHLLKQHPYWISVVFFFVGFTPGVWTPSLPSVFDKLGYTDWIPWVYIGMPVGAIISPFILGALSDGRVAANKLCGYVLLTGAVTMTSSFLWLHHGGRIEVFIALMMVNSLLSAPIWVLATQCALAYLKGQEGRFASYRLWGTVGWLVAGLVAGLWLHADESAFAGVIAGLIRFPAGLCCFLMPHCEPMAKKARFSILAMMGEGSREIWRDRNTRVILISAALIAIPLSSFFMYAPLLIKQLGVSNQSAWLSMATWFEVPAMLTLTWACGRIRLKWLLGFGLAICVVRQACFVFAAQSGQFSPMVVGILTHGLTFAYFVTVAQIYMEQRVAPELRGRALGMLSLMFGGVGSLIGVLTMGRVFSYVVDLESGQGWGTFWSILTILAVIPTVYFYLRYRRVG